MIMLLTIKENICYFEDDNYDDYGEEEEEEGEEKEQGLIWFIFTIYCN